MIHFFYCNEIRIRYPRVAPEVGQEENYSEVVGNTIEYWGRIGGSNNKTSCNCLIN